ncbi:MAG: hypothetical protein PUC06_06790 [Oscillospiraceae bacterium]|nr:hypothetical protein [Oscillospiraceae bacterium]
MKLYMERDVFFWGRTMELRDKAGRKRYTLTSEAYSLGKRLHICDLAGREALYIHQRIPSLMPNYEIQVYGKPVGSVTKDLTFLQPRIVLEGLSMELGGSVALYDYEILSDGAVIAANRPCDMDWGRSFRMEFFDRTNDLTALGVMIAVNCVLEPHKQAL